MVYKDMTMSDSSGMMMDASQMNMVFYSSTSTPLYSNAWTPQNGGQYAGTCIFLIILAIVLRLLFAYKAKKERQWRAQAWNRKFVVVADQTPAAERLEKDPDAKTGLLTANGVEARIKIVDEPRHGIMPWRFSVDLPRALIYTCIVGIGYLLMLAVMTQNVGYFFSVLAGTFVGELALGRYIMSADDHTH